MPTLESIANAVPADATLTEGAAHAVIEIAAMAVAADRAIHRDEITVLQQIAARLGQSAGPQLSALFTKLGTPDQDAVTKRMRAAAVKLESAPAREIAFKAAYAITLADEVSTDRESAFTDELMTVLSISAEDAARLVEEVTAAVKGG